MLDADSRALVAAMDRLYKYPRTAHLEGSKLQPGDEDLDQVPLKSLKSKYLVVEEKVDGANSAISFSPDGDLRLQCRGHYLTGGPRERQFDLFKTWAACHQARLWELLGSQLILYGEWVYAAHTVFYDRLPHYFLEFDIFDIRTREFWDTERRHQLLEESPVASVPVVARGLGSELPTPKEMVGPSLYKSPNWKSSLDQVIEERALRRELVLSQLDDTDFSEGLYLKVEAQGQVVERLKWVRHGFFQTMVDSESHWADRPILPNQLEPGVNLYDI